MLGFLGGGGLKFDFNVERGCFFHFESFGGFFLCITHFPNKTKFRAVSVNILVLSIISASISVIQFTIDKIGKQTITTTVLQGHWGSRNFRAYLSRPKRNLSPFFTICLLRCAIVSSLIMYFGFSFYILFNLFVLLQFLIVCTFFFCSNSKFACAFTYYVRSPYRLSHSKGLLKGEIQTALCHIGDNGQTLHSVGT